MYPWITSENLGAENHSFAIVKNSVVQHDKHV